MQSWMWIAWSRPLMLFFELFFLNYLYKIFTFLNVLSIPVSTINSLVWDGMGIAWSRPLRLFLNYLSENYFKTIYKIYSYFWMSYPYRCLKINSSVTGWMERAWCRALMLFWTIFTEQTIFLNISKKLFLYIFECLIHYCIRNKFFGYLNYFETMLKYVSIFWYVLSITVSTINSLHWRGPLYVAETFALRFTFFYICHW